VRARRVVTSRRGGASAPPYDTFNLGGSVGDDPAAVAANRARLAAELGLADSALVLMGQTHSDHVRVIDAIPGGLVGCDGLVTAVAGIALVALAADCVPMLLADERAGVVGAVHAGRPGSVAGIAERAVEAMAGAGAGVDSIDVLLGPAICGRCYEVPAAMAADGEHRLPGSACRTAAGTPGLDLRAGLARALVGLGVARVVVDPRCTAEDPELFSYRRDGVTGRHAGVALLVPP